MQVVKIKKFRINLQFESTGMKSFAVPLFLLCIYTNCNLSCDLQTEDIHGCDFDTLYLLNPQTGFTIAGDSCGIEIDKNTFSEQQPYVFYSNANEDLKYTLIMVDNDDPFTDEGKDYLQWMIINIDGTSLKYGVGDSYGETLAGEIILRRNKIKINYY
jgi:hypothetical protein